MAEWCSQRKGSVFWRNFTKQNFTKLNKKSTSTSPIRISSAVCRGLYCKKHTCHSLFNRPLVSMRQTKYFPFQLFNIKNSPNFWLFSNISPASSLTSWVVSVSMLWLRPCLKQVSRSLHWFIIFRPTYNGPHFLEHWFHAAHEGGQKLHMLNKLWLYLLIWST